MNHFDADVEGADEDEDKPSQRPAGYLGREDTEDDESTPPHRLTVRTPALSGVIRDEDNQFAAKLPIPNLCISDQ